MFFKDFFFLVHFSGQLEMQRFRFSSLIFQGLWFCPLHLKGNCSFIIYHCFDFIQFWVLGVLHFYFILCTKKTRMTNSGQLWRFWLKQFNLSTFMCDILYKRHCHTLKYELVVSNVRLLFPILLFPVLSIRFW